MNFIQHLELREQHAMFGASQFHWLNYDSNKLKEYYFKMMAKQRGTELHAFAAQCIKLGQKLPESKRTLNMSQLVSNHEKSCFLPQKSAYHLAFHFHSFFTFR